MSNIIDAIINLVETPKIKLTKKGSGKNQANNVGIALEEYIKDLFANTINEQNETLRDLAINKVFSYKGNPNNPPDSILCNGDAIEIKKIESKNSGLQLNSSYPKAKLLVDDPLLTNDCRNCESWTEKDIIYAVGIVKDSCLESLAFVYGEDYCASKDIYERIRNIIKSGVEEIPDVEFSPSKELGHINRVDPLGITYLRVRGMWGIDNPFVVFNYIYKRNFKNKFNFMCLINEKKFEKFSNKDKLYELNNLRKISIKDVHIENPNSPAKLRNAKLITFEIP